MQPDRVGVSLDEFIDYQTIDGRRMVDPLLLSIDEDGHIFFPEPPLLHLLGRGKFPLGLFHAGSILASKALSSWVLLSSIITVLTNSGLDEKCIISAHHRNFIFANFLTL